MTKRLFGKGKRVYYLLATFIAATMLVSAYLNFHLVRTEQYILAANQRAAAGIEWVGLLENAVGEVDSPGNDIFITGDLDGETARLQLAFDKFRKVMQAAPSDSGSDGRMFAELRQVNDAMTVMRQETAEILRLYSLGKIDVSAASMGKMDRNYANVRKELADVKALLRARQVADFGHQSQHNDLLAREQSVSIGLLILLAILAYGRYLQDREAALVLERQQHVAELDMRRLEEQLQKANRVSGLGLVAVTMAHEFNNVLMGIQPFADVIGRRANDEKISKAAAQILKSVGRGKRVTQEILRFTQPAEPALLPLSLEEWMRNLLPELQGLAGSNTEVILLLPSTPVVVRCDPAQLQQVITNLVLNARDAMAGKGVITLGIEDGSTASQFPFGKVPPGQALITVKDTGSGMTADVLEKIFEPLFTTKRTGTGIGLAVAQQVIVKHNGSIHVESKPGEGTTFFILLPRAAEITTAIETAKAAERSRVRRVVLVEDDHAVATGILLMLEMEGVEALVVERGGDALGAVLAFDPDAVILDIRLPDVRGEDVYEQIAARHPALPVLFSSGHADESTVQPYAKEHVAFLRKPYDLAALMGALDKITSQSSERQAAGQHSR